ncbi:MAG: class I SAM-dependent methyltransferase family protein [Nanoarchaeota archaeon]
MKGCDLLGNIALVKFDRKDSTAKRKKEALEILSKNKSVTTILEKTDRIKGRLRVPTAKYLAGVKTKECLYKENGCSFRFNVESCYFSPRLASERLEISRLVKKSESVLVMFGGVAPFAIVIAKIAVPKRVVSVELGRKCSKYALENAKKNKVKVEIIQGDVRRILPKLKEKFDRIVMARPNLKDSFLNVAFPCIKKSGIIHYYGFYPENEVKKLEELIKVEAKKAKKKIKILKIKKAGDIGVKKYRYRIDFKVV